MHRTILGSAVLAILATTTIALPGSAQAALPKAAVVLGDSFSSGEGGRWRGNSFTGIDDGTRADTDTAAVSTVYGWEYHPDIPYMSNSISNGCDRSRWAPISYLEYHFSLYPTGYSQVINLACSGARNKNLWPIASGGVSLKGEQQQIPQLSSISAHHDIDLIVLGVGGNDMGFSDVIQQCGTAWAKKHWTYDDNASCIDYLQSVTVPNLSTAWYNVTKSINLIRQEMASVGDSDYKIVLMGYPAIIPRSNKYAYEADYRRIRGCPFNGPDSDYVEDVLLPKLNATMEAIADQEGVDFINLHHAFDNHRLCEAGQGDRMVDSNTPTSYNTEWVRYLDSSIEDVGEAVFDVFVDKLNILVDMLEGANGAYMVGH